MDHSGSPSFPLLHTWPCLRTAVKKRFSTKGSEEGQSIRIEMTADTRQQFQGEERKRELHWEATLLCLRKPEKRGDVGSTSMSAAWRAWPPPRSPRLWPPGARVLGCRVGVGCVSFESHLKSPHWLPPHHVSSTTASVPEFSHMKGAGHSGHTHGLWSQITWVQIPVTSLFCSLVPLSIKWG